MSAMMPEIKPTARPRLSARARVQWDPARGKQVLLAPEGVLILNETGAAILALCDGARSVDDIAAELSATYNRPVAQDVLTFLQRLAGKRLVDCDDDHTR